MAIASVIQVRRNLLRSALALLGIAASGAREAHASAGRARGRRTREELLLAQAAAFVNAQFGQHGDLVAGPISLLQRQYGLGYGAALELAGKLEGAQVWCVYRDATGMRCARKVGRA